VNEEKEWKRDCTAKTRRERRKRRSGRGIHREDAKGGEGREGVEEGLHREDAKGAKEDKELG
jgi:hypothetical protein